MYTPPSNIKYRCHIDADRRNRLKFVALFTFPFLLISDDCSLINDCSHLRTFLYTSTLVQFDLIQNNKVNKTLVWQLRLGGRVHTIHHFLFLDEHLLQGIQMGLKVFELHVTGRGIGNGVGDLIRSSWKKNKWEIWLGKSKQFWYLLGPPTFWLEPPSLWSIPWWLCPPLPTSWCWPRTPCPPAKTRSFCEFWTYFTSPWVVIFWAEALPLSRTVLIASDSAFQCFTCVKGFAWWSGPYKSHALPRQTSSFLPRGFQHSSYQSSPSPLTWTPRRGDFNNVILTWQSRDRTSWCC